MLRTLEDKDEQHWRDFIKPRLHAYSCARNTTRYSLYELTLPGDLILGISSPTGGCMGVKTCTSISGRKLQKGRREKQTTTWCQAQSCTLSWRRQVLIRNDGLRGKHKLAHKLLWSKSMVAGVHIVSACGKPQDDTHTNIELVNTCSLITSSKIQDIRNL